MSESHRVRLRTGRVAFESEASSSASTRVASGCRRSVLSLFKRGRWNVNSLDQAAQWLTHAIAKSHINFEISDLVADLDHMLDPFLAHYASSEVIRKDADSLSAVLKKRQSRLLLGATHETQQHLKRAAQQLERVGSDWSHMSPAHTVQHDSSARHVPPMLSVDAEPRPPTFGR